MVIKVATVSQIREIETSADQSGLSYRQMMRNAGWAASAYLQDRLNITAKTKITILIGKGNNGGDGLVMAQDLASKTAAEIHLYLLEARDRSDQNFAAALAKGISYVDASTDSDGEHLENLIGSADVVVDALVGIGLRPPLRDPAAKILQKVNESINRISSEVEAPTIVNLAGANTKTRDQSPFVLALDCPSGIDCDSGQADHNTIPADATITFIAAKPGLLTFPAAAYVGDLVCAPIGIPHDLPDLREIRRTVVDQGLAASLLPARPIDGHKGSFGKVMLVAGSANYIGAIALAGEAACRSGVGLATIASASKLINIVATNLREPTWLPLEDMAGAIAASASETLLEKLPGYQALLIGCGLGLHESTRLFLANVLRASQLPPLVLDADGLNIVSQLPEWWRSLPANSIITPHSGEMARLTGLETSEINADRWAVAEHYAKSWNLVVVLKGAHTLIAAPDGRTSVIPFKIDALGTAGTGDILAGLIAGLRAQSLSAFDAARLGAYIHASAGSIAAETIRSSRSLIASDVLAALGAAFDRIESL